MNSSRSVRDEGPETGKGARLRDRAPRAPATVVTRTSLGGRLEPFDAMWKGIRWSAGWGLGYRVDSMNEESARAAPARFVPLAPRLCRAIAYLAAVLVVAPFVYHLAHHSLAYLGLFEDDYFYYGIIADKLLRLGKLTYDGSTLTNGFHPLWFLVLLLLRAVTGGLNDAFYGLLCVVFVASMVATYELSRAFARTLGAPPALAGAAALLYAVATDVVLSSGMETAVDVPLLLWLFLEVARPAPLVPRRAAWLGLVASVAILGRLDIALVVPLAFLGWALFARPSLRTFARALAAFCAGGLAVPAYAAFNLAVFHTVMPVSAMAKQLVTRFGVNVGYLMAAARWTPYGTTAVPVLAAGVAALVLLARRRARGEGAPRPEALFAGGLALAFAAIFFAENTLNGWIYFGWYSYPFQPALVAALAFAGMAVAPALAEARRARAVPALVAGAMLVAAGQGAYHFAVYGPLWSVEDNGLLAMSLDLARRMQGRPGTIGMGAIAGFATYLMDDPVVQLEGLVADRAMVEHIRHTDDLVDVLGDYKVDYLVVSLALAKMEKDGDCYTVTQPNAEWAGKRVAKMRGRICSEPIEHFQTLGPDHGWSVFRSLDTYVFDVRKPRS